MITTNPQCRTLYLQEVKYGKVEREREIDQAQQSDGILTDRKVRYGSFAFTTAAVTYSDFDLI
jgi:hypothetical protein